MKALASLLGAIAIATGVACGGDDGAEPTSTPVGSQAPASPTAATIAVADLFPDLTSFGLARGALERIADPAGRDIAFAVYAGPKLQARAEIRLYPTAAAAAEDFPLQAAGWKAPPVGAVFPFDLGNIEGKAVSGVDEARAYVATRSDAAGNRVWTDVYRVGRVVVIAHVLSASETDAGRLRAEMASRVAAAAAR